MAGTNLVTSGFPRAYFPSAEWDGTTRNHERGDIVNPATDDDYKRLASEVMAIEDHLSALFTRTAQNDIKLVNAVWEDLRFPVQKLTVPAVNNPTITAYKSGMVLSFDDEAVEGNEERVYFSAQLPHTYKMGTNLSPHVHWVGEDGTAGNVRWKLTYNIAAIGVAFGDNVVVVGDVANGGADKHNYGNIADIDMSTFTDITDTSIMIIGELRRNSSHANDTLNGKAAYLLEFDIHYQINKLGSSDEETHAE